MHGTHIETRDSDEGTNNAVESNGTNTVGCRTPIPTKTSGAWALELRGKCVTRKGTVSAKNDKDIVPPMKRHTKCCDNGCINDAAKGGV